MQLRTIVVGFDGSSYARAALDAAIELGQLNGSRLVLVSAIEVTQEFETEAPGLTQRLEEKAGASLAEAATRVAEAGLAVEMEKRIGEAETVIVAAARAHGADLIVLGRQDVTGLKSVLRRDIIGRVIRQAPCKVLVAPSV